MTIKYHVVIATNRLKEGSQLFFIIDGEEILLVQHDNQYFAIAYMCSHAEYALESGKLEDGCITCPYHRAKFCLKDGSVQAPPAVDPIKTYPVKVENDMILIGTTGQ